MPASLLRAWECYWKREPFGPIQEDLRAAWVAMLLFNANRGKDQKAKALADFFPSLKEPAAGPPSDEELQHQVEAAMAAWGGVKR